MTGRLRGGGQMASPAGWPAHSKYPIADRCPSVDRQASLAASGALSAATARRSSVVLIQVDSNVATVFAIRLTASAFRGSFAAFDVDRRFPIRVARHRNGPAKTLTTAPDERYVLVFVK